MGRGSLNPSPFIGRRWRIAPDEGWFNYSSLYLKTKKEQTMTTLKNEERTRCEVWTRVMGYHRPVAEFNVGKKSEHQERKHFVEQRCRQFD